MTKIDSFYYYDLIQLHINHIIWQFIIISDFNIYKVSVMINSVSSYESKKNPFGIMSTHNSASDYWLNESKPTEMKADDFTINDVLTPEKARKTHNLEAIGISIAITVLATSGAILLLLKGGPKGLSKSLEKLKTKYTEKLQNEKLKGETAQKTEFILNKINYFTSKAEAVNNFTTMKDYAFKRFMYALGAPTRKIHKKITGLFEKLGQRTVEISYGETATELLRTSALNSKMLNKINSSGNPEEKIKINGETLTKREWLEKLKTLTQEVRLSFDEHFGDEHRKLRLKKMHNYADELEKDFNNKGHLWFLSKDTFKTFVASQKMNSNKIHIQKPIKTVRKEISCTKDDIFKEADETITKISSLLGFGEKNTLNALNTLKNDWKNYTKGGNITKKQIIKDINDLHQEFLHSVPSPDKARIDALKDIEGLETLIKTSKNGKVEDILDIYKALLPDTEYNKIKKSYDKTLKSLDKSINLETEEFVNKLRDLTMGSAATDILTNLVGIGTLVYYLGKSDNKEQKIGITLKYGFPALTLIGMGLYGNAKLFAGSKALAFGIISSAIVNRIGTAANDILQKHFEKKNKIAETKEKEIETKTN